MILAVDVDYKQNNANTAGVVFTDWDSENSEFELTTVTTDIAPYEPGAFYKRELPCILSLLSKLEYSISTVIIDGNVYLDDQQSPGLGYHLYQSLETRVKVVGIAKSRYGNLPHSCELTRGNSKKPLYITAVGIANEDAKACISQMYGSGRIPYLIKRADVLSKQTWPQSD